MLPVWLAYLRAMLFVLLVLLVANGIAYAVWGKYLEWPYVLGIAVAWPFVMTAIT
jgi:hypothetical protein